MPLWLVNLWAKIGSAVTAVGVVLAAILGIFLYGRSKGVDAQKEQNVKDNAERVEVEKEVVEKIDQHHEDVRTDVEEEINKIDAPNETNEPVRIADAPKGSAADRLKGW